jgi:hypothetical protein
MQPCLQITSWSCPTHHTSAGLLSEVSPYFRWNYYPKAYHAPHANEAMEPIWQQHDHPDTFDASQPCPDAAYMNCDSETLQFVYNQLDNHISCQLADNGLVDSSTMLDTEDTQVIMFDTDESFALEEEEVIMEASKNLFDIDDEDDCDTFPP